MSRRIPTPHWLILAIYVVSVLSAILIVATLPPNGDSVLADLWFPAFGIAIATLGWVVQARGGSFAVLALMPSAVGTPSLPQIPQLSALDYLGLGVLALIVCWLVGVRDVGGYVDRWRGQFDKQAHFALAGMLTLAAILAGVDPVGAAGVTIVLGIGWEFVERFHREYVVSRYFHKSRAVLPGFWSWRDVVSDIGGAAVAGLWGLLVGR